MVNRRILIIDDDPGIRQAYRHILSPIAADRRLQVKGAALFDLGAAQQRDADAGFAVTVADNGRQGIEAVRIGLEDKRPYAAALVDMKMPGLNGAETARQIWALDPAVKIAMVTAYSENSPEEITRMVGRKDLLYIRKPFNSEEIRQLAVALTQQWNAERDRDQAVRQLEKAHARIAGINQNLQQKVRQQAALLIQSEKMSSIGLLAAGVAHEINNPLSYINVNLETLKGYAAVLCDILNRIKLLGGTVDPDDHSVKALEIRALMDALEHQDVDHILGDIGELTDESLEGVKRAKEIVEALKSFSHAGHQETQTLCVNDVLEDTIKVAWNEVKYRAELSRSFAPGLPLVECDRQQLGQVFMNLIVNAAQAMEKRGRIDIRTRYVEAGRRTDGKRVEVRISDNGPGMPPEVLSKIFDPFFTTKPVGQGTGLGLSISYDIIAKHGGSMTAESDEGSGTVFTIQLPLKAAPSSGAGGETGSACRPPAPAACRHYTFKPKGFACIREKRH